MSKFIRLLSNHEHKKKWERLKGEIEKWRIIPDFPTYILEEWPDSNPSFWKLIDGKWDEETILIAMYKKHLKDDKTSYIIIDEQAVLNAGLAFVQCNGKTGWSELDVSDSHHEIKGITGKSLFNLLIEIIRNNFEVKIITKEKIHEKLYAALEAQQKSMKKVMLSAATTGSDYTSQIERIPSSTSLAPPTSEIYREVIDNATGEVGKAGPSDASTR